MRDMLWDLQQFIAHPDFVMPDRYPHPTRLHKLALVMEGVNISEDDDKVVRLLPTAKAVLADARREDISVTPTKSSGSFTLTKPNLNGVGHCGHSEERTARKNILSTLSTRNYGTRRTNFHSLA
jgi:hypothetical protein